MQDPQTQGQWVRARTPGPDSRGPDPTAAWDHTEASHTSAPLTPRFLLVNYAQGHCPPGGTVRVRVDPTRAGTRKNISRAQHREGAHGLRSGPSWDPETLGRTRPGPCLPVP